MGVVRMDIQTIVVSGGPVSSLVILRPHRRRGSSTQQLPIQIGPVESASISMAIDGTPHDRPLTHDLLSKVISSLGASVSKVVISDVRDTTFYARIDLATGDGRTVSVDSRPSDAIALAVRTKASIYADEKVLDTATLPDFKGVKQDEERHEMELFHDFVEHLSPDDFNSPSSDIGTRGDGSSD